MEKRRKEENGCEKSHQPKTKNQSRDIMDFIVSSRELEETSEERLRN